MTAVLLLPVSAGAQASSPELLADINTSPSSVEELSPWAFGDGLSVVAGRLVFTSSLGVWGSDGVDPGTRRLTPPLPEGAQISSMATLPSAMVLLALEAETLRLWRTDGTSAGTEPLTPPLARSPFGGGSFQALARLADRALMTLCPFSGTCEIWSTDGTVEGTGVLPGVPAPSWFGATGRHAYFLGYADGGTQLYVTDGTAAGTRRVAPVSFPVTAFAASDGRAYFATGNRGSEVWTSDGTPEGTALLRQFRINGCFSERLCDGDYSYPEHLEPVPGGVVFEADDGQHGLELWFSDGTAAGTRRLTDLPRRFLPQAQHAVKLGENWLVAAAEGRNGLARFFSSNGSPASTSAFPPCEGRCRLGGFLPEHPSLQGERLYTVQTESGGLELRRTGGTMRRTQRLATLCRGACSASIESWRRHRDRFYFLLGDSVVERSLWVTDGTAAGTRQLSSRVVSMASFHGEIYFVAASRDRHALELWRTGGTLATTRMAVRLISRGPDSLPLVVSVGARALLFVQQPDDTFGRRSLWVSDGSPRGTAPIPGLVFELDADGAPYPGLTVGERHFFVVNRGAQHSSELWVSDGTPEGSGRLADVPGATPMAEWGGGLLFTSFERGRCAFWVSDGSLAGTRQLFELPPPVRCPSGATALGTDFLFTAGEGTFAEGVPQLWRSDGTAAGLVRLTHRTQDGRPWPPSFTRVGEHVFFLLDSASGWPTLWVSDGTAAGTRELAELHQAWELHAFGDSLYLTADSGDPERPRAVFRVDGSSLEVVPLGNVATFYLDPYDGPYPWSAWWAELDGRLYFTGQDPEHGRELWTTDGTAAGTRLVRDLEPGPVSADPSASTAVGSSLYFSAFAHEVGRELWRLDESGGVGLVEDLSPGSPSSAPGDLLALGDRLLFVADDGLTGREPWVVDGQAANGGCQPSTTHLCLLGGRFEVEVRSPTASGEELVAAAKLSEESATFSTLSRGRPELYLKLLDGRTVNHHHWMFLGSLTERELTLTLTDTTTGVRRRWVSPAGQLTAWADLEAFGPNGAHLDTGSERLDAKSTGKWRLSREVGARAAVCEASSTRLCLENGRFAAELRWRMDGGDWQLAQARRLGQRNGWFSFNRPERVELGLGLRQLPTSAGGGFGLVWSALSSAEVDLRVTDTTSGEVRVYTKPRGVVAGGSDSPASE